MAHPGEMGAFPARHAAPPRQARGGRRQTEHSARRSHCAPHHAFRSYLYVLPATLIFVGFVAYPVLWVVLRSCERPTPAGGTAGFTFAHYARAFADPVFWLMLRNMTLWGVITIPVQMVIGGTLAYLIERCTRHSRTFFRTMFFLPVVTSVSVVAIVWSQMYAPYYGIVQEYLRRVGLQLGIALLADPDTVIYALIVVNIWQWTGFSMIMYVAGINNIPEDIFDASKIDGARGWPMAWYVIVPIVSPVKKSLLLLGIIGTLQTFPVVYLMTNGGPDHASEIFGTYIFKQGFVLGNTEYSAALSVIVLVLSLVLSVVQIVAFGAQLAPQRVRQ
jgi:ABC-type sugar transport system permease subunit